MEIAYDILAVNGKGLDYKFSENEIGLEGRACKDISCGDVLLTKSMEKFIVIKIYSFKREVATISASMACALVVKATDKEVLFYPDAQKLQGQLLYAVK